MLFDTPIYILFLCLVVVAYWRLGFRNQNRFLLAASYLFYGWWDWRFLLLMIASTVIDYFIAIRIADTEDPRVRKTLLALSLVINFSILGFFKYFNFFAGSLGHVLAGVGIKASLPVLLIILPPGISFYTFQEVAYIVDVYSGKLPASRSFLDYGLFISLFPHLIAGPIQRPAHLLPQVQKPRHWDSDKAFDGLLLIMEGLFRKCVIADNCALVANAAFSGALGKPSLVVTLLGMYAFAWQIYGDFSGYSDIARGSAQLLGFHFMVNFRQPYFADSIQDFWRRWHVSLSTWLRDYLYIPLGGNRKGEANTYRNLLTDDAAGRVMAWRQLDVRVLGRPTRRDSRDGEEVDGGNPRHVERGVESAQANLHIPRRLHQLGVLPSTILGRRLGDAEGTRQMELAAGIPGSALIPGGVLDPAVVARYLSGNERRRILFRVLAGAVAGCVRAGVRCGHRSDGGESSECIHLFPILRPC